MQNVVILFLLLISVNSCAMLVRENSFFTKPKIERLRVEPVVKNAMDLGVQKGFCGLPAKNIVDTLKDSIVANCFVNNFANMTWNDAGAEYYKLSDSVRKKVIKKINFIDKHKGNKLFSSVFYMATVLPNDIQEKIVKHFFRNNDTCRKDTCLCNNVEYKCVCQPKCINNSCMCTFEKERWGRFETSFFKKKSIGESLYRYSIAHELSLGKLPYTRLFFDLMNEHDMEDRHKIIFSDDRRSIVRFEDGGGNYVSPENTQLILDYVVTELFDLTKNDILAVMDLWKKKGSLGKKVLQRLVDLDDRYSVFGFASFHENNHNISYRGKHTYRYYVNDHVIKSTLVGLVMTSVISIPALLIGLSRGIETLCQKNICDDIVSKNASCARAIEVLENDCKSIVENTKGVSGENFIPDYAPIIEKIKSAVEDPMQYGMFEQYMIHVLQNLSFVFPGCLPIILCLCQPHGTIGIDDYILFCAFFGANCAAGIWFSEYPEDWKYGLLHSVALSIGIGIGRGIYVYANDNFTDDKTRINNIRELFERKDIEIL